MTGFLLTQSNTLIIGQAAWLLGKVMDVIHRFLYSLFGVQNIGIDIILLTIVIYTLMIPLAIKQQKFSKMSAAMNPEIQKVQKKYKNKKDQASMQKMQEETQMVYDKYGVSPTGGCLSTFIQFPFLIAMYSVVRNVPAYVSQVKAVYTPLIDGITATNGWQKIMEKIGEASPILVNPDKFDYTKTNTLVDVLYKFQSSTWETLSDKFPALDSVITSTQTQIHQMNSFLGLNIAESPMALIKNGIAAGTIGIVIMALLIPILSGVTQFISVKIMPQPAGDQNNQMASTMKSMNVMMPLMSVFMCFTLPTGLGLYWIVSALVRTVQNFFILKHLSKISMDDLIQENVEKAAKKRENKKIDTKNINEMAQKNVRNIKEPVRSEADKLANQEKLDEAKRAADTAQEGSLTSKANLVKRFNESNR